MMIFRLSHASRVHTLTRRGPVSSCALRGRNNRVVRQFAWTNLIIS